MAAIGVNSAIWLVEFDDGTMVAIIEADEGPELPLTLNGLHSARWAFNFDEMSSRMPFGVGRARVIFSLGDGSEISTPWRPLPSANSRAAEVDELEEPEGPDSSACRT